MVNSWKAISVFLGKVKLIPSDKDGKVSITVGGEANTTGSVNATVTGGGEANSPGVVRLLKKAHQH